MPKEYFRLFSFCIPVMGKEGAIIVNLQQMGYTVIPQFLCELLTDFYDVDMDTLREMYSDQEGSIGQHLHHLVENKLGFFTHTPECYPRMSLEWSTPEKIKYAVLQIGDYARFDYADVIRQLDALLCKNIEIWFTGLHDLSDIRSLLAAVEDTVIRAITLVLPYQADIGIEGYQSLGAYSKLDHTYLHRAPERIEMRGPKIYGIERDLGAFDRIFTDAGEDELIIYIEFFTESQHFNPYYNRKICIDQDGYIRNCLTHERHFGNIREVGLSEVAEDAAFQELWYACHDSILGIKDSEFRYCRFVTNRLEKVDDLYYRTIA